MTFKKTVDYDKAVFLRRTGWTYKDIAEYLGCSEVWCKCMLSKVHKDKELMYEILDTYLKEKESK